MKTKNTPLFIARLALTLFVICAVVAILLALVNRVTAPRIETINAEKATKALSAVLSDADQAITSRAVTSGVNAALECAGKLG